MRNKKIIYVKLKPFMSLNDKSGKETEFTDQFDWAGKYFIVKCFSRKFCRVLKKKKRQKGNKQTKCFTQYRFKVVYSYRYRNLEHLTDTEMQLQTI